MSRDTPKQGKPARVRISNKKARFNFVILEKLEAGIVLKGTEVKSLRNGDASLAEAYARIDRGQVTLHNFQIQPYKPGNQFNHDPKRVKQLLVHRREIKKLASKVQIRGQTLIPLVVYFNDSGKAKVELALARGKSHADRRQDTRAREDRREIARAERRGA